jgi:hypothetical protein
MYAKRERLLLSDAYALIYWLKKNIYTGNVSG